MGINLPWLCLFLVYSSCTSCIQVLKFNGIFYLWVAARQKPGKLYSFKLFIDPTNNILWANKKIPTRSWTTSQSHSPCLILFGPSLLHLSIWVFRFLALTPTRVSGTAFILVYQHIYHPNSQTWLKGDQAFAQEVATQLAAVHLSNQPPQSESSEFVNCFKFSIKIMPSIFGPYCSWWSWRSWSGCC